GGRAGRTAAAPRRGHRQEGRGPRSDRPPPPRRARRARSPEGRPRRHGRVVGGRVRALGTGRPRVEGHRGGAAPGRPAGGVLVARPFAVSRRALLAGTAGASLVGFRARGAAPSTRLVVVVAHGGWDPSLTLDPKPGSPLVAGAAPDLDPDDPLDVEALATFG